MRKLRSSKELVGAGPGQCGPGRQPGEQPPEKPARPAAEERPVCPLGQPLTIRQVAALVGLSPWSVRHGLIPQGLPYFRAKANGKLLFFANEVIRWLKAHEKGGTK